MAGQIAKMHGSRVIGIAGGKERCDRVVNELGFDGAIDRHSEDIWSRLQELCPDGIDIFFDNNALPEMMSEILAGARPSGRVVLCVASQYYMGEPSTGSLDYISLIMKRVRMEGVYANDCTDRFPKARKALGEWIREGKIKPVEDVMVGFENAPKALQRVFTGTNFGKQLLRLEVLPVFESGALLSLTKVKSPATFATPTRGGSEPFETATSLQYLSAFRSVTHPICEYPAI